MSDPIDLHVLTATEMYPKYIECSVKNTPEFTINHKTIPLVNINHTGIGESW